MTTSSAATDSEKSHVSDVGTFDYIVTGAGSAGCVMAARLSENGRHRVLLLEAGPADTNPFIHMPMGLYKVFINPKINWMFESEPIPQLDNRTSYQPRGKTLGGTSSINGMVYMRGTPGDYDQWRQLGCEGWDWESVLPYFKKAEDQGRGPDALHGVGGPLKVSDKEPGELARAMVQACVEAGIPRNADFNGPSQEGAGYYQTTTSANKRWSTATAYLKPARGRSNLTVVTQAHATRILIRNGRATGIEYRTPTGLRRAHARGEVVVSGGAYGSPHLLQHSGIGPAEHLRKMGIEVVRDVAGVGANLQDHFNSYLAYRCSKAITLNDLAASWTQQALAGLQYFALGSGPLTGIALFGGAFVRTDPRLERPDMQLNLFGWSVTDRTRTAVRPHPFPAFSISPVHLRPEGRGTVRIKSPDPLADPEIRFNFLTTDYDIQAMLEGMRIARRIAAQPALRPYVLEEIIPGASVTAEAEMIAELRQRGVSNLHPVGTCRMGNGPDAVVDPRLRVHGVAGLRVVDASIMPAIIAGNTNAPTIMIAEKAAAMMLADVA